MASLEEAPPGRQGNEMALHQVRWMAPPARSCARGFATAATILVAWCPSPPPLPSARDYLVVSLCSGFPSPWYLYRTIRAVAPARHLRLLRPGAFPPARTRPLQVQDELAVLRYPVFHPTRV